MYTSKKYTAAEVISLTNFKSFFFAKYPRINLKPETQERCCFPCRVDFQLNLKFLKNFNSRVVKIQSSTRLKFVLELG